MSVFIQNFDRHFRIVYQPYNTFNLFYRSRRFFVTAKTLKNYVGSFNANTALLRALNSKMYKTRVKLRKHGIIDFYSK